MLLRVSIFFIIETKFQRLTSVRILRPPAYYKSLMEVESKDVSEFSKDIQQTLLHNVKFQGWFTTKDGFNSSIINLKSFSALEGHKGNNTNAKPEVKKQGPDMLFFDSEEQIQPKVKNELAQLAESTGALDLSNYKGSISSGNSSLVISL